MKIWRLVPFLALAACSSSGGDSGGSLSEEFLIRQEATTATLTAIDADEGQYTLSLQGVDVEALYFATDASGETGAVSMTDLAGTWWFDDDELGQVPPHAALEIDGAEATQDVLLLSLQNPSYDADAATLTYDAVLLEESNRLPTTYTSRADNVTLDAAVGPVTLIIQDALGAVQPLYVLQLMENLTVLLQAVTSDSLTQFQTLSTQTEALIGFESDINRLQMELEEVDVSESGAEMAALVSIVESLNENLEALGQDALTKERLLQLITTLDTILDGYGVLSSSGERGNAIEEMQDAATSLEDEMATLAIEMYRNLSDLLDAVNGEIETESDLISDLKRAMRSLARSIG